jgi:hypothetical protein
VNRPALGNFKSLIFKIVFLNSWNSRRLAFESSSGDHVEKVSAEDTACGLFSTQQNCRNSSQFGDWIQFIKSAVWYREKCVGAKGCKRFIFVKIACREEIKYRM